MLRVALVGAGGFSQSYRSVYANLPGVEWALAVDIDPDVLAACKAIRARRTSQEFEAALAADIDVVDISTPNFLHEEQALAALAAGKHVLLQKPIANSLAAADRIVAAGQLSRGKLGMYMYSYTNPLVWEIKEIIKSGLLGQIQTVRARDARRSGLLAGPGADNWRGSRDKTGGGSFVQLSLHAINLIQWWLNTTFTEVFAYSANQYCPNIGGDDVTVAVLKMQNGAFASLESGYASEGSFREIHGTRGSVVLRDGDLTLQLKLDAPYHGKCIQAPEPGKTASVTLPYSAITLDDPKNPLNQQRMFLECIGAGREPFMSGLAARRDLAVVMAAYESAGIGRPVEIDRGS